MNSSSLFYFASLKFSSSWFVEFAKSFELLFDFANVFSAVAFLPLDDVALQCCVLCFLLLNFCYLLIFVTSWGMSMLKLLTMLSNLFIFFREFFFIV